MVDLASLHILVNLSLDKWWIFTSLHASMEPILEKWWSQLLSMTLYQWSLAGKNGGTLFLSSSGSWNQTPHVKHIIGILGGEKEYHLRYNLICWASG